MSYQGAVDWLRGSQLHIACREGKKDLVQQYLENTDVNGKDGRGNTPLHCACTHGHIEIVEILLSSDADIYVTNGAGQTPSETAEMEGHHELVDFMIGRMNTKG